MLSSPGSMLLGTAQKLLRKDPVLVQGVLERAADANRREVAGALEALRAEVAECAQRLQGCTELRVDVHDTREPMNTEEEGGEEAMVGVGTSADARMEEDPSILHILSSRLPQHRSFPVSPAAESWDAAGRGGHDKPVPPSARTALTPMSGLVPQGARGLVPGRAGSHHDDEVVVHCCRALLLSPPLILRNRAMVDAWLHRTAMAVSTLSLRPGTPWYAADYASGVSGHQGLPGARLPACPSVGRGALLGCGDHEPLAGLLLALCDAVRFLVAATRGAPGAADVAATAELRRASVAVGEIAFRFIQSGTPGDAPSWARLGSFQAMKKAGNFCGPATGQWQAAAGGPRGAPGSLLGKQAVLFLGLQCDVPPAFQESLEGSGSCGRITQWKGARGAGASTGLRKWRCRLCACHGGSSPAPLAGGWSGCLSGRDGGSKCGPRGGIPGCGEAAQGWVAAQNQATRVPPAHGLRGEGWGFAWHFLSEGSRAGPQRSPRADWGRSGPGDGVGRPGARFRGSCWLRGRNCWRKRTQQRGPLNAGGLSTLRA